MIPTTHGKPCLELVSFCDLWDDGKGGYKTSSGDDLEGWKVILRPNALPELVDAHWLLCLEYQGVDGPEGAHTLARLHTCQSPDAGIFLKGMAGKAVVVVHKNDPRVKKAPLSVYFGVRAGCGWLPGGEFR